MGNRECEAWWLELERVCAEQGARLCSRTRCCFLCHAARSRGPASALHLSQCVRCTANLQGLCTVPNVLRQSDAASSGVPWHRQPTSRSRSETWSGGDTHDSLDTEDPFVEQRQAMWRLVTGTNVSPVALRSRTFRHRSPEVLLANGLALTTHVCTAAELAAWPSYVGHAAVQRTIPRAMWLEAQGVTRCARCQ